MTDLWYAVEGIVVGWLSFSTDGGEGREIAVVQVTKLDDVGRPDMMFVLRWIGHDLELRKRHEHPTDMAEEIEIGDTLVFNTCSREQDSYAIQ